MSNINFDNPWLLLLILPLMALVIVPFVIAVRKENANIHNILSLVCHVLIVIAVVLGIAGMNYDAMITETQVYVLVDVSYSSNNNLDVVDGYVRAVQKDLPKNSQMALIAFGRNYQVLTDLGGEVVSVREATEVDASATDIASALRYAGNLFDENVIKRIVVITDGHETVADDKLTSVVTKLKEENIYIDVIYLDNNLAEDVQEIQLTDVEYTASAFMGHEETALLQINSNNTEATRVFVDITCNGNTTTVAHTLYAGENLVSVPLNTDAAGTFEYEITVRPTDAADDTSSYNNTCLVTQTVSDKTNVLFLGGSSWDCWAGEQIYGTEDVTYIADPDDVPTSAEDLCAYDEIVLCNFDVRTLIEGELFVSSLDTVVSKFGKTLTVYGDTYIEELTLEENAVLSNLSGMLPVTIGNADQDSRLMTILLDVSTSTNFSGRLEIIKTAVSKLMETLNDDDDVMIIYFAADQGYVQVKTKARNTEKILKAVDSYTVRAGTSLEKGLEFAKDVILGEKYHQRELVIISDSVYNENKENCVALAEELSGNNVVISALNVYPPVDTDYSDLLESLVKNNNADGKGYYQSVQSGSDIDYIIGEILEEEQEVRIEGKTYPLTLQMTQDAVLNGVTTLPSVGGFWYNAKKTGTTVVVTVQYPKDKVNTVDVPLYSYWEYGSGKVAYFASDISTNWISGWDLIGKNSSECKLMQNIRETMLPEERIDSPFLITTETENGVTTVQVSTSAFQTEAILKVTLTYPDGGSQTKELTYESQYYTCQFTTEAVGRYQLHLVYDYASLHYETDRNFEISYYPEYDAFTTYNVASLYRIVSENGEVSLDGELTMDNSQSATRSYRFSFIVPLMVFCVAMFVVDVIIRMIRWKDIRSLFVHGSKKAGRQKT